MFIKVALLSGILAFTALQTGAGVEATPGLSVDTSDSIKSVLETQVGQVVEIRLKSGDKISGKLANVGDKLVHLSQLVGQEFFDAVVDVKDVTAVVLKVRQK